MIQWKDTHYIRLIRRQPVRGLFLAENLLEVIVQYPWPLHTNQIPQLKQITAFLVFEILCAVFQTMNQTLIIHLVFEHLILEVSFVLLCQVLKDLTQGFEHRQRSNNGDDQRHSSKELEDRVLLQVACDALVAMSVPLPAQSWKEISFFTIFLHCYSMKFSNVFIIEEVFLVLVSKWNLFHEEVNWIILLQLLDLLDAEAAGEILATEFVWSEQYFDRRWCNFRQEGQ